MKSLLFHFTFQAFDVKCLAAVEIGFPCYPKVQFLYLMSSKVQKLVQDISKSYKGNRPE